MRGTKYKAWDKTKQVMRTVRGIAWKFKDESIHSIITEDEEEYNNNPDYFKVLENFELVQFTGLLDKNGKEIYEGDIVKGRSYNYHPPQFDFEGIVEWQSQPDVGLCYIIRAKNMGAWELNQGVHRNNNYLNGEVIGNKFENPGLLEEEK